jgi:hypothetical protein
VKGYHRLGIEHRISYRLGAKPKFELTPDQIPDSDCSGWVRYLLYHGTGHTLTLPEGSVDQREWCEAAGLHRAASYELAAQVGGANRLFICFIVPESTAEGIGHVFLLSDGETIECHFGRGVDSRSWITPILKNLTSVVYELPLSPA